MKKIELGPLQRKWVDALRSGKYKQGVGQLKIESNGECCYCCLGVANEVCELNESGNFSLFNTYQKIGLLDPSGYGFDKALSYLNDTGYTFLEIADMLEEKPEKWFSESK